MIDQEVLTPGANFRAFLGRDYPELIGAPAGGRERDVHLLIDQQSTTAKSVFELLVLTSPHEPPMPELQLAIIANALELVLRTGLALHSTSCCCIISSDCCCRGESRRARARVCDESGTASAI